MSADHRRLGCGFPRGKYLGGLEKPRPRDRGIGWDFDDIRDHYVEEIFGVRPVDVRYSDAERYLDIGRAAVAEAVESTVREFRRPSSPTAGVLVISQRDSLPGPGWGLVDAFGRPKSSYFAFRARAGHGPSACTTTDSAVCAPWSSTISTSHCRAN